MPPQTAYAPGARAWLLVPVVLYFCCFSRLDAVGLVGPDEPRYAAIARGMAETGDWVTPRLHGKPWFEKPVLYYWAAGAAFRYLGVGESSARLPSALAAAVTLAALAWAALNLYGRLAAWLVCLIWPTTVAAVGFSRAATTDMLFTAFLSLAMVMAARILFESPRGLSDTSSFGGTGPARWWPQLAFGAALGAATLAKGPAAIVLAGGCVALWALLTRRIRDSFRLCHSASLLAFALVALPWYLICAARNGDFAYTFFYIHHVERYLTPRFLHEQPVWYFGPILGLGLVPWTGLFVFPLRDALAAWRERAWRDSAGFLLACWVAFPLLFFSFSKSKLPGYILPVIPPLVLLLAGNLARRMEAARGAEASAVKTKVSTVATILSLMWVVLAVSARYWTGRLPAGAEMEVAGWATALAAASAMTGIVLLALARLRRTASPLAAVAISALLMSVVLELTNRKAMPQLDAQLSSRLAARAVFVGGADAAAVQAFRLHRAWEYGLNFYLSREMAEWIPNQTNPALVFTSVSGLAELDRLGRRYAVLARTSEHAVLVRLKADAP